MSNIDFQDEVTSAKNKLSDAGNEVKQRMGDALRASTDVARDKFKEASDAAKGVLADAAGSAQAQVQQQQQTGADYVDRVAQNMRDAARAFEADTPIAARGMITAADYIEQAADKLRDGSFRDLIDGTTDFAKRQPAAFLGLTVLAGFAAVRFLKATGEASSQTSSHGERSPYESSSYQGTGGGLS